MRGVAGVGLDPISTRRINFDGAANRAVDLGIG
jgi:hypothetical protein